MDVKKAAAEISNKSMAFSYIHHAIFSSYFRGNFQENHRKKSQRWHTHAHSWLFSFLYMYDFITQNNILELKKM